MDIGSIFGNLTTIKKGFCKNYRQYWVCRCKCGTITFVHQSALRTGAVKGCKNCRLRKVIESNTKHGFSESKNKLKKAFYQCWASMKTRCLNKKDINFKHYGGRGIRVCKRWLEFKNFRSDMWFSYKSGLSLDRINNNGSYTLKNCRWATSKQQNRNRRNSSQTRNFYRHRFWLRRLEAVLQHIIRRDSKSSKFLSKYIGCDAETFLTYIKCLWKKGMSWKNYGPSRIHGTWQLDHIIPCSQFDLSREKDRKKCFHYLNLRPYWSKKNARENTRGVP